jgi:hypothetical protein
MTKWMCLAGLAALMLPVTAAAQCYDYHRPTGEGYRHYYYQHRYPDYYPTYRSWSWEHWRWREWD